MIDWEYYKKRRNIKLVSLIKRHDISTYQQLVELLNSKNVGAPPEEEFKIAHKIAMPKVKTVPPAKKASKAPPKNKTTPKRRGRPRKAKG